MTKITQIIHLTWPTVVTMFLVANVEPGLQERNVDIRWKQNLAWTQQWVP
jgi:hypothetical protein